MLNIIILHAVKRSDGLNCFDLRHLTVRVYFVTAPMARFALTWQFFTHYKCF